MPVLRTGTGSEAGISESGLKKLEKFIEQKVKSRAIPGTVCLLARNGIICYFSAHGIRRKSPPEALMENDAVFDICSMTKPIVTASATLRLCEKGLLRLGSRVADFIPEFKLGHKRDVTVHQLLAMCSGLPFDVQDILETVSDAASLWKRMYDTELLFPPGEKALYSDLGYRILGRILEQVSGEDLTSLTKKMVIEPLEMTNTGYNPTGMLRERCAETDFSSRRGRKLVGEVDDELDYALGGALGCDGLFSTAVDLATFMEMILDGGSYGGVRIVNDASVKKMTTNQVPHISSYYDGPSMLEGFMNLVRGYGFEINIPDQRSYLQGALSERAFGKSGATGTFMWADPKTHLITVFLTNKGAPDFSRKESFETWIKELGVAELFSIVDEAVL